jgi:hypothetical protein
VSVHAALAAGATLLALAFALSTFERWLDRRRRHELAWSLSLLLFAAGSAALWAGAALGWGPLSFRLFYLFGAILNVPFLATGTVYLLWGRAAGDRTLAGVSLAGAFAAGVVLSAPLTGAIDPDVLPQGSDVFGALPRVLAATASGAGALVVFGGAVWSAARLRRGTATRRLAAANVLIALGTLVLSAGGLLNSVVDEMDAFALSLVVGIGVIFAGFLVAGSRRARPLAVAGSRPSRHDRRAGRVRSA